MDKIEDVSFVMTPWKFHKPDENDDNAEYEKQVLEECKNNNEHVTISHDWEEVERIATNAPNVVVYLDQGVTKYMFHVIQVCEKNKVPIEFRGLTDKGRELARMWNDPKPQPQE